MTKRSQKEISENNCTVYCSNSNNYYIKGDKLVNQINIKKIGCGIYCVWSKDIIATPMTEQDIIKLTA
jgi:hypothetical protein